MQKRSTQGKKNALLLASALDAALGEAAVEDRMPHLAKEQWSQRVRRVGQLSVWMSVAIFLVALPYGILNDGGSNQVAPRILSFASLFGADQALFLLFGVAMLTAGSLGSGRVTKADKTALSLAVFLGVFGALTLMWQFFYSIANPFSASSYHFHTLAHVLVIPLIASTIVPNLGEIIGSLVMVVVVFTAQYGLRFLATKAN